MIKDEIGKRANEKSRAGNGRNCRIWTLAGLVYHIISLHNNKVSVPDAVSSCVAATDDTEAGTALRHANKISLLQNKSDYLCSEHIGNLEFYCKSSFICFCLSFMVKQTDRFDSSVNLWRRDYRILEWLQQLLLPQFLLLYSVKASQHGVHGSVLLTLNTESAKSKDYWLLLWIRRNYPNQEHFPVLRVFGQDQPCYLRQKP